MALIVLDSTRQRVNDAEIFLNKKRIKYDKVTNTYRKRSRVRKGTITIKANGQKILYDLKRERRYFDDKDDFWYDLGDWVRYKFPIRNFVGWYHDIREIVEFRYDEEEWLWKHKVKYIWSRGYVATNQPKYKPGDTVKVKAYLANVEGHPIRRKVELRLYEDYHQRRTGEDIVFKTILSRNKEGSYTYEFVLADSLKLDNIYTIAFGKPSKNRLKKYRTIDFRYEDYELDKVKYDFKNLKRDYQANEPIILKASGKDQNGNYIPDGNIRLTVTTDRIDGFYDKTVIVPDTLWVQDQQLNTGAVTQIEIPQNVLPAAKLRMKIKAEFYNSNGEYQEKNHRLTLDNRPFYIKTDLVGDSIVAKYYKDGIEQKETGTLRTSRYSRDTLDIQFPYRAKVNPYVKQYYFGIADLEESLNVSNKDSQVSMNGHRTSDSIFITIQNPLKLQVVYTIEKEKQLIAKGEMTDDFFLWKKQDKSNASYSIHYQYVWAGKAEHQYDWFRVHPNLLNITLEQPAVVAPNETAQVKVKATTIKGKPAKNVNLTAGAINATFGSENQHFKEPGIIARKAKKRFKNRHFNINRKSFRNMAVYYEKRDEWDASITTSWYQRLNLEQDLFYKLRFPEKGYYERYDTITSDTFYQHIAQFAPYVVASGKELPVFLIYCNDKLVYYNNVDDNPPYSFIGIEGWNKIALRTLEQEYIIDSVYLKKGHKLEFSIDANHYLQSAKKKHITKIDRPDTFTEGEKALLRKSLLILKYTKRGKTHFIRQGDQNIHTFQGTNGKMALGLFNTKDSIHYAVEDGFETNFSFEPGFEYIISKNRERLYASNIFPKAITSILPYAYKHSPNLPKQLVYSPSILISKKGTKPPSFYTKLFGFIDFFNTQQLVEREEEKGNGRYKFEVRKKSILATALVKDSFLYEMGNYEKRNYKALERGKYTFYLFTIDSMYLKKEIFIKNDTLLFEQLDDYSMVYDTNFIALKKLRGLYFFKKQTEKVEEEDKTSNVEIDEELQQAIETYRGGNVITGKVYDMETGESLIGATVYVIGTKIGTATDLDGNFSIAVPIGTYHLGFSYVGYRTQELTASGGDFLTIIMDSDSERLEEVVVVGYGSVKKSHLTGSVSVVNALGGRAAGVVVSASRRAEKIMDSPVKIRGMSDINTNSEPLMIVDGVPVVGGELSSLDENMIAGIEVLKGASATAIYGSRGANGVILITTKKGRKNKEKGADADPLLSPKLRTDFRDYAYWQPNLMTDKNGEAYFTVTFPDNITKWRSYAMGMDRKRRAGVAFAETQAFQSVMAQVAIPRFLIEGDETEIVGKSINYTLDTFAIQTTFKQNGKVLQTNKMDLAKFHLENIVIKADEPTDSLNLSYELASPKHADGEQRTISVLRKGIEETVGDFKVLERDTTVTFSFEKQYGEVTLYAQNNVLEVLLEDIEDLKKYPYHCNEQTASRLIALVMERKIRNTLGQPFKDGNVIRKMIKRLEKSQNRDGSWGWWQGGKSNIWITAHVIRALHLADPTKKTLYDHPLRNGIRYIVNHIALLEGRPLVQALALAAELDIKLQITNLLPSLDSMNWSQYDQFQILKIQQIYGQEVGLDSLDKYQKQTTLGGKYWGDAPYLWFDNQTELTLLAYDIHKKAGNQVVCDKIIQYFLEKRNKKDFRNTYQSAKILYTILPDLLKSSDSTIVNNQLVLKGSVNQTVTKFPFKTVIRSTEDLTVEKTGNTPLFITTNQVFHNNEPKEKSTIFEVKTAFQQKGKEVKKGQLLKNFPTKLILTVDVKESADYVMIEIPIPAGCSYNAKPKYNNYREVHREYYKNKVAIFCQSLPVGQYTFTVDLEPRFTGTYTLNPAKVEQMYFPIFYGRNGMKSVEVR